MGKLDTKVLMDDIRQRLGDDTDNMGPFTTDDLAQAIAHPKASEVIAEMMEREHASVQQGEPAPDFTLSWLPGSGEGREPTMTLSEHFGRRPVALIFGSYT